MHPEQQLVTATDGTALAVDVLGRGRPVVIVHGSLSTAAHWQAVARPLSNHFTVFVMNRRGHGPSPEGPRYSLTQEVEDVAAVMAFAGPDATLFGHSFGGALSLVYASAESTVPPAALIAYEPGIRFDTPAGDEAIAVVEELLRDGDPEGALITGMRKFAGFSEEEIAAARESPGWAGQVALAPTWPREMRAIDALGACPERFNRIATKTLLVRGSASADWLRRTTADMAQAVPDARLTELSGQGHAANATAPSALAEVIRSFLQD